MSEFLVEAYLAPNNSGSPSAEEVAAAADRVTRSGRPVRLLSALVLPADETCLYLFEADSLADVEEAAKSAGLRIERSSEALSAWTSDSRTTSDIEDDVRTQPNDRR